MINVIIPMAGYSKRFFDCGYTVPKYMLPLGNKTMIEAVVDNLNNKLFTFTFVINTTQISYKTLYDKLKTSICDFNIVEVDFVPDGPAMTCLLGIEGLNLNDPLIIVNTDQIIEDFNFDYMNLFCTYNNVDGLLGVFHNNSPKCSYVRVNDFNEIIEVKEKQVISNMATNGFHYWKHGSYFTESVFEMMENKDRVNGEYYIAPSYNYLIKRGLTIKPFYFNLHYPIGIPEDYESYKKMRGI